MADDSAPEATAFKPWWRSLSASCQRASSCQEAVSTSLRAAERVVQKINNSLESSPLFFQGFKIQKLNNNQRDCIVAIFLNLSRGQRDESLLDSFAQRIFATMQRIILHKKSSAAMNKLIKLCLKSYKYQDRDYSRDIIKARKSLFEQAFSCLSDPSPSEKAYRDVVLNSALIAFHAMMSEVLIALESERGLSDDSLKTLLFFLRLQFESHSGSDSSEAGE